MNTPDTSPRVSLREAFRYWFKLGFIKAFNDMETALADRLFKVSVGCRDNTRIDRNDVVGTDWLDLFFLNDP